MLPLLFAAELELSLAVVFDVVVTVVILVTVVVVFSDMLSLFAAREDEDAPEAP
jgi:hypothetical protein